MLSKTDRPHMTAFTIDEKLSSKITISEASFATIDVKKKKKG
jgi:hypothetical protein